MSAPLPHFFFNNLRSSSSRLFSKGSSFIVDELSKASQDLLSLLPSSIPTSSTSNSVLLCRSFYLKSSLDTDSPLISEEKFTLEDTLREFTDSSPDYSFDQYFWDLQYSPFESASNHFVSYVLSRKYKIVVLGSWDPSRRFYWLPSFEAIYKLKSRGVKIIMIWFDSCSNRFIETITKCLDLANLHVLAENPRLDFGNSPSGKYLTNHPNIVSPCWPFS